MSLTGVVVVGSTSTCLTAGLSIPVSAGTKLVFVALATATGIEAPKLLNATVSVSMAAV